MSFDNSSSSSKKSVKSPLINFSRESSATSASVNANSADPPQAETASIAGNSPSRIGMQHQPTVTGNNLFSTIMNLATYREDFRNGSDHSQLSLDEHTSVDDSLHAGVEQIITRPRRQSYEEMALSLASSNPQQFYGYEGKAKITVKIIYPPQQSDNTNNDRTSETKTMSLRALLLDILNEAQRYEDEAKQREEKKRNLNRRSSTSNSSSGASTHRKATTLDSINRTEKNVDPVTHDLPVIIERSLNDVPDNTRASSLRRHGTVLVPESDESSLSTDNATSTNTDSFSVIHHNHSPINNHTTGYPTIPVQETTRSIILPLRQRDLRRMEAATTSNYHTTTATSATDDTATNNNSSSKQQKASIWSSHLPEQDPYVLIRKHAVLFCFGELVSAVVQAQRLILIVRHEAEGADAALEQLERHISEWIRAPHSQSSITSLSESSTPPPGKEETISLSGKRFSATELLTTLHPFAANPSVSSTTAKSATATSSPHNTTDNNVFAPFSKNIPSTISDKRTSLSTYNTSTAANANNGNANTTFKNIDSNHNTTNTTNSNQHHPWSTLPFSLRVYDALFATMFVLLQRDVDTTAQDIDTLCQAIGTHSLLSLPIQEALRLLKGRMTVLRQRTNGYVQLLSAMTMDTVNTATVNYFPTNATTISSNNNFTSSSNNINSASNGNLSGMNTSTLNNNIINNNSNDAYYAFLNLSALHDTPSLYQDPLHISLPYLDSISTDLDFMFEGHVSDFQALFQRIRSLDQRLSDVEDMVSLRLDISRNELLVASTVLSVVACTIGFAGFITGAFGMNLDNSEEFISIKGLFGGVFGFCLFLIVAATLAILQYFRMRGILPTHTSERWANVSQIVRQQSFAT